MIPNLSIISTVGTQDNNTQGGPSRTDNRHGIRNSDWFVALGGDGHQPATEPGNPDIVYAQSQQGYLYRVDLTTGESVFIRPQPDTDEDYETLQLGRAHFGKSSFHHKYYFSDLSVSGVQMIEATAGRRYPETLREIRIESHFPFMVKNGAGIPRGI